MLDALVKESNHGGARLRAGRKPAYFKKMGIKPVCAAQLLEALDVPKIIGDLVNDRNPAIRLRVLNMLFNRAYGLPKEIGEINVSGGTANTTKFVIEYLQPKFVEIDKRTGERTGRLLEGETPKDVETVPVPATAPIQSPPPPPPEPTGNCRFHGDFLLKESGGREICPQCKRDAERQESWLARLQPGGGLQ